MSEAGSCWCLAGDAGQAWSRYGRLVIDSSLHDDPHFIVQIRHCPDCSQQFLWIFTEFVNWQNGEDAQYRAIVPVTAAEARALAEQGPDADLASLGSLGRDRRYLKVDWPSDDPRPTASWATGEFLITPGS